MSDSVARLNVALEGRYAIERELGEGGMATKVQEEHRHDVILVQNFFEELGQVVPN